MEDKKGTESLFNRDLHVKTFSLMLNNLPEFYQSEDTNRILFAYFAISALDVLNALDQVNAKDVINWVYRLQILPSSDHVNCDSGSFYGFQGPSTSCIQDHVKGVNSRVGGHLAFTYCALCILKIAGDDFSRVDCKRISTTMKNLQQADGSFTYIHTGAEADLRFVYCTVAVCYMLNDWSGIDIDKALRFIINCQTYEGGFGLVPGAESHGGASYCAVAALKLMGHITYDCEYKRAVCSVIDLPSLLDWAIQKQTVVGGFQGRANKEPDSCYSFWLGGLLKILNFDDILDHSALRSFLLTCQTKIGGFSKYPKEFPDLFHSFYGLCGFVLLKEPRLKSLCWELGIAERAQ